MSTPHLKLCLLNPAFTEEEGVTISDGQMIAFRRSDGTPRMLHVDACIQMERPLPPHGGLHSVTPPTAPGCDSCQDGWALFEEDNEAFNADVAKTKV